MKRDNSRWVATEEVLDKWHAQSVGVSAQDYLEKKRAHQRLTRGHADKVQVQAQQKAEKILKQFAKATATTTKRAGAPAEPARP